MHDAWTRWTGKSCMMTAACKLGLVQYEGQGWSGQQAFGRSCSSIRLG